MLGHAQLTPWTAVQPLSILLPMELMNFSFVTKNSSDTHGRLIFRMADLWRAIFVESVGR